VALSDTGEKRLGVDNSGMQIKNFTLLCSSH
jgi:hypothetical protein